MQREVAAGVREVPFEGREIPVLGCTALVVFKALLDRTRDWAYVEAVAEARAADLTQGAQVGGAGARARSSGESAAGRSTL